MVMFTVIFYFVAGCAEVDEECGLMVICWSRCSCCLCSRVNTGIWDG